MDTISKAKHEFEVAEVSERKLRLRALELAVATQAHPDGVAELAMSFLNFLTHRITPSSGNIFADIGLAPPGEAVEVSAARVKRRIDRRKKRKRRTA